jgi:ATP-dependent helicase/DNAse subunit B
MEEVLSKLSGDAESRERFLNALKTVEAGISDEKIRKDGYFKIEKTSPTRLETYAKCPYRYFADKILNLKETGQDLSAMRKGSILHFVLQQFFDPRRKKDPKETLEEFIEREIEEGLKLYPMTWAEAYQEALDRRELFEMLLDFLRYETDRLATSSFKPGFVEYSFGGSGKGEAPPLEFKGDTGKIKLQGRVDRIDMDPEKKFAVVMDYKRSYSFKSSDLELGTALQLPLYLLAAQKHLGLAPLGAAIYSIRDHKRSGFYCEGIAKLFEKEFSSRSSVPGDIFQKTLDRAIIFTRKFMKEIHSAEIPVRPRSCESFCPYDTVCRIEKWKLPVILEEIKKEDRVDRDLGPMLSARDDSPEENHP